MHWLPPLDQALALVGIPLICGVLGRLLAVLLVKWLSQPSRAKDGG